MGRPIEGTCLSYSVLYWLRHIFNLFVLLKRKVELSEAPVLPLFMALFEIGLLLLGAGVPSGGATPFRWLDWLGLAMILIGSLLNTGSELQRWSWKKKPSSKGYCYREGLFKYSMHINYFSDTVPFTGRAIIAASIFAWSIPILITSGFVFLHTPPLDRYLTDRYGAEFKTYAKRTTKFVPFVY